MKVISRSLLRFQEKEFVSAIRDKIDYARMILYSARLLLINYDVGTADTTSGFKIIIDKMSRLFYYNSNKFFSISFPFNVTVDNDEVAEISTYSGTKIDSQIISSAISILTNEQFKLKPSPIDFWVETDTAELPGLSLLEEIFLFEPSYIRYDIDPENENGKMHPLHHLDINYSSYGTYKLGLKGVILNTYFENILDITTDCAFISD